MPNIITNHAITYTNTKKNLTISNETGPGFWSFFCLGVLYISVPVFFDASLLMKHYKRMEEKLPERHLTALPVSESEPSGFAAREIFFSQSVKHCLDLVSDASSLWNFCARSSAEVISQGN